MRNAIQILDNMVAAQQAEIRGLKGKLKTERRANWELQGSMFAQASQFNVAIRMSHMREAKQCETRPYIMLDAEAVSQLESEKINDLTRERDHLQKQLADITLVYAMVPDGTCVCYDRGAHETVKGLERKLKAAIDARTSQHRISLDLLERVKGLRKQLKKRPEVRGTECYFRRHQIFLGATHDGVGDHLHRRQFEKWFATEAALIGVFQSG